MSQTDPAHSGLSAEAVLGTESRATSLTFQPFHFTGAGPFDVKHKGESIIGANPRKAGPDLGLRVLAELAGNPSLPAPREDLKIVTWRIEEQMPVVGKATIGGTAKKLGLSRYALAKFARAYERGGQEAVEQREGEEVGGEV